MLSVLDSVLKIIKIRSVFSEKSEEPMQNNKKDTFSLSVYRKH